MREAESSRPRPPMSAGRYSGIAPGVERCVGVGQRVGRRLSAGGPGWSSIHPVGGKRGAHRVRTVTAVDASPRRPHVVILGGGFGGIGAAVNLRGADVDVT